MVMWLSTQVGKLDKSVNNNQQQQSESAFAIQHSFSLSDFFSLCHWHQDLSLPLTQPPQKKKKQFRSDVAVW